MLAQFFTGIDAYAAMWHLFTILAILCGAVIILSQVILGQSTISSRSLLKRKYDSILNSPEPAKEDDKYPLTIARANRKSSRSSDQQSPQEKRGSLRRGGNPVPVVVYDVPGQEPVGGMVVNRSRGGLCLSTPQPVGVGQILGVRSEQFPESLLSVRVRVRHCKQKGNCWHLGCQFVEELPWSTLLMFG
jgi:hypothetical protein